MSLKAAVPSVTSSDSAGHDQGRIWKGPDTEGLYEKISQVRSVGHHFLQKLGGDHADTVLFVDFESGRQWTGAQLRAKILNVSCALLDKFDIAPGTTFCIRYDKPDHVLIASIAIICVGGTVACIFPKDPYSEILNIARKVEPRFLLCHSEKLGFAKQLESDLGYHVEGIQMDVGSPSTAGFENFLNLLDYDHTKSPSLARVPVPLDDLKSRVAIITMSSGTTGMPKAVTQTHWNILADLISNPRKSGKGINFICSALLDYASGRIIMFGAIHLGYKVIMLSIFEPKRYLKAIEEYRVNVIYLGAASFYNLITQPILEDYDISSVKSIFPMGAKIIYLDELARFLERHPHVEEMRQGYGASEFCVAAMNFCAPAEYLRDSANCGHLLPGLQAKIVDPDTGCMLGSNQQGVIHVKGEAVFPGYYDIEQKRSRQRSKVKDASQTKDDLDCSPFVCDSTVFDQDGFYISGDYAYFNDEEELHIIGRKSETMFCRGAKKVLPQELEAVIDQHPATHMVCVLGIPNKRELTRHCPRAFVVPKAEYYSIDTSLDELSSRLSATTLSALGELDPRGPDDDEKLTYKGRVEPGKACQIPVERRRLIVESLMKFVDERVGWEKQLTGGIVLLDDIPTSRATGKFNKNYLRSLTIEDVEIFGDRSE